MGEEMVIKVQCSCGELTYKLPEKMVELIERVEKEQPGAKEKICEEIEIALHSVTTAMVGSCLCIGPMGFRLVAKEVSKAMLPLAEASILTMETMRSLINQGGRMGWGKK